MKRVLSEAKKITRSKLRLRTKKHIGTAVELPSQLFFTALYAFFPNSVRADSAGRRFLNAKALRPIPTFSHVLMAKLDYLYFTLFIVPVGILGATGSGCMGWVKFCPKILRHFFDLPKKINYA
jgi:hypothetical protein